MKMSFSQLFDFVGDMNTLVRIICYTTFVLPWYLFLMIRSAKIVFIYEYIGLQLTKLKRASF